jgi:hypothetical protein
LAAEISRISDEQLRANLRHTMSKLFMFLEDDLEGRGHDPIQTQVSRACQPRWHPGRVASAKAGCDSR